MKQQSRKNIALALVGGALIGLCASAHAVHHAFYTFDHGYLQQGTNPGLHEQTVTLAPTHVLNSYGKHPALLTNTSVRTRDPIGGWNLARPLTFGVGYTHY